MSENSKKLPPIPTALSETLFELIDNQGPIKEHQLLTQLYALGYEQFQPSIEPLALFRSHFLLFHLLYRLEDTWIREHAKQIHIHTLAIELTDSKPSQHPPGLVDFDSLRDYYLDYQQFIDTQERDVVDLLDQFWSAYSKSAPVSETEWVSAKATLQIEGDVSVQMVKQQFRKLSQQHHPDKGGCAETFKQLVQARDKLLRR